VVKSRRSGRNHRARHGKRATCLTTMIIPRCWRMPSLRWAIPSSSKLSLHDCSFDGPCHHNSGRFWHNIGSAWNALLCGWHINHTRQRILHAYLIHRKLALNEPGNVMVSPFSIAIALAMATCGKHKFQSCLCTSYRCMYVAGVFVFVFVRCKVML